MDDIHKLCYSLSLSLFVVSHQDQLLPVKQQYMRGCIWCGCMMTDTDNTRRKKRVYADVFKQCKRKRKLQ
jgi:hypothetical protein